MSAGTHPAPARKRRWRGLAALALLAVAIVLAGPICDAYELSSAALLSGQHDARTSAGHADDPNPCCAFVEDGPLMAGQILVPAAEKARFAPLIAALPLRWAARAGYATVLDPPQPPPHSLPYHVRSARILA